MMSRRLAEVPSHTSHGALEKFVRFMELPIHARVYHVFLLGAVNAAAVVQISYVGLALVIAISLNAVYLGYCLAQAYEGIFEMETSISQSKASIEKQRDLLTNIMNAASDGFCFLEGLEGEASGGSWSGTLTGLSPKLQESLLTTMETCDISDVVVGQEDTQRLLQLIESSSLPNHASTQPCIITCRAPPGRSVDRSHEFEALVFPYRDEHDRMQLRFQLASEKRPMLIQEDLRLPLFPALLTATPPRFESDSGSQSIGKTWASESSLCYTCSVGSPRKSATLGKSSHGTTISPVGLGVDSFAFEQDAACQTDAVTYASVGTSCAELLDRSECCACGDVERRAWKARARPPSVPGPLRSEADPRPFCLKNPKIRPPKRKKVDCSSGDQVPLSLALNDFKITSAPVAVRTLLETMKHWNLQTTPVVCCPYHMYVTTVKTMSSYILRKTPCDKSWRPLNGWQCPECACMNSDDAMLCEMCELCIGEVPE